MSHSTVTLVCIVIAGIAVVTGIGWQRTHQSNSDRIGTALVWIAAAFLVVGLAIPAMVKL